MLVHEVVKISLWEEYKKNGIKVNIHPKIGQTSPELSFLGLIKKKNQDIVAVPNDIPSVKEKIKSGPLIGNIDPMGKLKSEKSLVVGVRSQLSSVDKNFDTLMERTFAETLNLRLRLPKLVMGEVYLLPVVEYDDAAMKRNQVSWKRKFVNVEKFVKIFSSFSNRKNLSTDVSNLFRYERSALIFVDFRPNLPKIYLSYQDLINDRVIKPAESDIYKQLSPVNFAQDLVETHIKAIQ